jgi:dethiobiotin synthetase
MRRYIVTGTDTGIGKTVFAAGLTGHLNARYWKPVQAGLEDESDSAVVARLSGLGPDCLLPEAYRLQAPCSPHQAAATDGVVITPEQLGLPEHAGALVVEGAGGLMVPLSPTLLTVDMFARWGLPVILVARTTLGTINHSLLSIEALRSRGISLHGIAFVGQGAPESESIICAVGGVRHLGCLPPLDPLNAATLATAFAATIRGELL